MKHEVVTRKWYKMYLEFHDNKVFFHTDVLLWNKEVKKQYLKDFCAVVMLHPDLYAMPYEADNKMVKFGDILGFKVIDHHECLDGIKRKLFKYERGV